MRITYRQPLANFSVLKIACIVFVFCGPMAILSPAQTLTTFYSFCTQANCADGGQSLAAVVQGTDGNFYGTTSSFGTHNAGTVFKLTPDGTFTILYSFCSHAGCADGGIPHSGLTLGTDGNFYGTTYFGGTGSSGTVFKITPSGSLTTLHSFCSQSNCPDGAGPVAGLLQGSDGKFYGTTTRGGANTAQCEGVGCGTVFTITRSGSLTTLYSFCSQTNCSDGSVPYAGLVQGTDGNFYGTTFSSDTVGTIYKITPTGTLTTLHSFNGASDGSFPYAGLTQAIDGSFWGTTSGAFPGEAPSSPRKGIKGTTTDAGTIFRMTPDGTLTTLYSFCSQTNCLDGSAPFSGLVKGSDGNFYGTTGRGADQSCVNGCGTVFQITPGGTFSTLYSFSGPDGGTPVGRLLTGLDGNLYGTTYTGGTNGQGTVYRFTGPRPSAVQFVPATPCRLVDTRETHDPIQGGTFQSYIVPQLGSCNIPAAATAYSLNVTVVPHQALSYLTIWPAGANQPFVSTMNSTDGRTKANAAIVPAGVNGAVSVYVTDTSDVVLDINGYFAPILQSYQFFPLTPCRVVDTRDSNQPMGLGPPAMGNRETRELPILTSPCLQGISNPQAYSFNITVSPNPAHHPLNYLTVWPSDQEQPFVSTLNNPSGTVAANAAIVPAAASGDVSVFTSNSTDVIMDINGYFATPAEGGYAFYPVIPCRAYDSRNHNGQPFMGERTVSIVGSACAPPSSATAYIFNATVVPPGFLDFLTLWPDTETQPMVSTLNAYDGFITSNMAILPNLNGSIDAYASQLTHLILDISGYFAP